MKTIRIVIVSVFLCICTVLFSQHSIQGVVISEENEPMMGQSVVLSPGNKVAITNIEGKFIFENIKTGTYTLVLPECWINNETEILIDKSIENVVLYFSNAINIDEVIINSVRFNQKNNPTQKTMSRDDIVTELGVTDMPYIIQNTPAVVVTSDAGAGVGYTGMRIRGTDQTRINVTINGIPLNDAESQNVFFVDLPDLAASAESIQIQRGIGTSSNGAASFGASVNVKTHAHQENAGATVSASYGSFDTKKASINFHTGELTRGFYLNGRISKIESDGYIERATSDLSSIAVSPLFIFNKSSLRYDLLYGKERTYQAWYGISKGQLDENRRFNPAGTERAFAPYREQVDDYKQVHHQIHFNTSVSSKSNLGVSLHYTPGKGFFEEYKADEDRLDYGLNPVLLPSDTIFNTDLVRRRWLDNDFYGIVASFSHDFSATEEMIIGGGWNHYAGRHFGEIIWAEFAQDVFVENKYYDNDANKYDGNVYVKYSKKFSNDIAGFVDLQLRSIKYDFEGPDLDGRLTDQTDELFFTNPKLGLKYKVDKKVQLFFQTGVAQKEPNRNDYTESSPNSRPKAERLWDTEFGAIYKNGNAQVSTNVYLMTYKDQLVLNGQINDVGAATRINVDNSYRTGLELDFEWKIAEPWRINGNYAFSQSRLKQLTQYVDDYDESFNYLGQKQIDLRNRPLTFSPEHVAFGQVTCVPVHSQKHQLQIYFRGKYVGEQFIDLSGDHQNVLPSYQVFDTGATIRLNNVIGQTLEIKAMVNNIFSHEYSANAWSYKYFIDDVLTYDQGFYPQALRHFLISASVTF